MNRFAVVLLLFFLLACGSKTAVPNGILPVPKMTDVLWDVMLADGLASHRYLTDSVKRFDTSVILYQEIAAAHGTSQQQLRASLRFYESRPDLLQIILDTLQKRATLPLEALKSDTSIKRGGLFGRPIKPAPAP